MSQLHTIELPKSVYDTLIATTQAHETTPAEWIAAHLPQITQQQDRLVANQKLRQCTISTDLAAGTDNVTIDADLAREYEN